MAGKHVVSCIKDVEHQVQTASKVVLDTNNFARQTFFKTFRLHYFDSVVGAIVFLRSCWQKL